MVIILIHVICAAYYTYFTVPSGNRLLHFSTRLILLLQGWQSYFQSLILNSTSQTRIIRNVTHWTIDLCIYFSNNHVKVILKVYFQKDLICNIFRGDHHLRTPGLVLWVPVPLILGHVLKCHPERLMPKMQHYYSQPLYIRDNIKNWDISPTQTLWKADLICPRIVASGFI